MLEAFCASLPCGSLQPSGTFRKPKRESRLRSAKMQPYVTLAQQSASQPLLPHLRERQNPGVSLKDQEWQNHEPHEVATTLSLCGLPPSPQLIL